jgi:hypothetical protein
MACQQYLFEHLFDLIDVLADEPGQGGETPIGPAGVQSGSERRAQKCRAGAVSGS